MNPRPARLLLPLGTGAPLLGALLAPAPLAQEPGADAREAIEPIDALSPGEKEWRWRLFEHATGALCEVELARGRTERACEHALRLLVTQSREGFEWSESYGYPALLVAARTLHEAGGIVELDLRRGRAHWYASDRAAAEAGAPRRRCSSGDDVALLLLQCIRHESSNAALLVRCEPLVDEITRHPRPGLRAWWPDVSELDELDRPGLERALEAYRRALLALEGDTDRRRRKLAPQILYRMGRAFQRLDRHLEACFAFREGCRVGEGEREHRAASARELYRSVQIVRASAPFDPVIRAFYDEAEHLAVELTSRGSAGSIPLGGPPPNYEAELARCLRVEPSSTKYESALVRAGVCRYRLGRKGEALATFVDYLDRHVLDPRHAVEGDADLRRRRREAMASATFYRALIEYEREDYEAVIETARDYPLDCPEQETMAPWAMRLVGKALAKTGAAAEAWEHLRLARKCYPDSKQVDALAIELRRELGEAPPEERSKGSGEDRPPR